MCKVTLSDEEGLISSCFASRETLFQILEHYHINTETNVFYMNGKIVSKEKLMKPVPETGTIHLAVKAKSVLR